MRVGWGVRVLFENSIVCQCIFCLWIGCVSACHILFVFVWVCAGGGVGEPLMANAVYLVERGYAIGFTIFCFAWSRFPRRMGAGLVIFG